MPVKPSRLILIAAALVVVAAAALGFLYWKSAKPVQPAAANAPPAPFVLAKAPQAVPQVAFNDGSGGHVEIASFKGKYVLLNLWATWCAPCVRELPALAKLKASVHGKFDVVAVDVGRGTAADARTFLDGHGAKALGTYVDSNLALLRAFGAYGLPLTILIDPKGREIGRAVGPAAWDTPDSVSYFTDLSKS
jgi:thiol-disulfide isomerase/thioredoxin